MSDVGSENKNDSEKIWQLLNANVIQHTLYYYMTSLFVCVCVCIQLTLESLRCPAE